MKKWTALFLIALTLIVTACSSESSNPTNAAEKEKQQAQTAVSPFPVTVTDASGQDVTIKQKPERIVSLIPSNTEITYALGAGDRVVGVSKFDNYPAEVKAVEKIGGQHFNVEKIISLKPDVVLAYETQLASHKDALDQLRKAGIQVVAVNESSNFKDVYHSITLIGKVTGTSEKAGDIIRHMKETIAGIKAKASTVSDSEQKSVWVEVSPAPDIYTTGTGTFMNQMLETIHAKNIAADQKGWVKYSPEAVVKKNPDVIVLTYGNFVKHPVEKVLSREGWQKVAAVKNHQVYAVDSDLVSRPGPRLTKGLEKLAQTVYPNVFQ
ncbi:MAG TPA: ABC transporter substrate-binding protein [Bacillales bacterium]|nr:ABC transporter substrate-binding protein [Bacillales bacterium]